jgi:hypothetical protein
MKLVRIAVLPMLLLGAAPAPSRTMPDVVEAGRVAATLSDWQTICFFLVFLLVASQIERIAAGWHSRATAVKVADALDRLGEAIHAASTEQKVMLAVIQQMLGGQRKD